MNRVAAGASTPSEAEDDDRPRPARLASAAGSPTSPSPRQAAPSTYQDGDSVYSVTIAGGGGGGGGGGPAAFRGGRGGGGGGGGAPDPSASGAAAGAGGGGGGARRRVSFDVTVKIDKPKEWDEMFDDAWGTMKYRFYDPKMHGKDWDADAGQVQAAGGLRRRSPGADERHQRDDRRAERLPHRRLRRGRPDGARPGAGRPATSASTSSPTTPRAATRSTHVYEDGPADKDWIKVEAGNYLIAIDGKPAQGRRRLLRPPGSPPQPQGRADAQHQARGSWGRGRSSTSRSRMRAYEAAPLRALGQGAAGPGRQALRRPRRLPAHQGDGPAVAGPVPEGAGRVPAQGGPRHRRALEWRRQHRAGAAGDPGPAPLPGLAAAGHRADEPAVHRLLRSEGRAPELAERLQRRDVPRRLPRPRPRQGGRHRRRWAPSSAPAATS